MRQTLFYIPPELFGYPLFGFGLLFVGILIVTALMLARAAFVTKNGEDFFSAFWVGLLGTGLVVWVAPAIASPEGFPIRGYGVFLMLAILASATLILYRGKVRWNLPPDALLSIIILQVLFGLVGARIFYLLEYHESIFYGGWRDSLIRSLNLTQGGLVVYGSIFGGLAATGLYLRRMKWPFLATLDLFAPALMLGIAIGRIGCLMNGCCFGGVCETSWGIMFPAQSPAHYHQMEHGLVSWGGFTPESPKPESETVSKKIGVGLKSTQSGLVSDSLGPVTVASVESGSEAQHSGLLPGSRILRVGFIAPHAEPPTETAIQKTETIPIRSTGDLFHFMVNSPGFFAKNLAERPVLILDVLPQKTTSDEGTFERVAFHPSAPDVRRVWPTQLFSALGALLLCVILLVLDRWVRRDGIVFSTMLLLYAVGRFGIEMVRTDESSFFGTGLTISQCASIGVFLAGMGLLVYASRRLPPRGFVSWKS